MIFALFLAACGQSDINTTTGTKASSVTGTVAIESAKTIGEVRTLATSDETQTAAYGNYYIVAFPLNGTWYRVIATMTDDQMNAYFNLDFEDEDGKQAIADPLTIDSYENLSEQAPEPSEYEKYIGRTIQELIDAGWYNYGWMLDTKEFWLEDGIHGYTVVVEEDIANKNNLSDEDIYPLTIKSITYNGILNATNIDLNDDGKIVAESATQG